MRGLAAVVLVVWSLGIAGAQPPTQHPRADALFAKGRDLVERKDYKGACALFEQAIAIDPTAPGTMLNLGLCYEHLEKYATSLYWFRKAQAAAAETDLKDHEDAAKEHTRVLASTKVATARIDISAAPADVSVTIDGRPILPSEYQRFELDAGSKLVARARGKEPFVKIIEVDGRDAGTVQVVMADLAAPTMIDRGQTRRKLAYVLGGTGVVLWGVTLAYALEVRSVYNKNQTPQTEADARDKLRYIATPIFIGGTVAAAAAVYLYLTAPKPSRERMDSSAFSPMVGPDQLGVAYGGRF